MRYKKIALRLIASLFFLSVGLALLTVNQTKVNVSPETFSQPVSVPARVQAARFSGRTTPFFYPFKTRPTHMNTFYSFTQDYGRIIRYNSHGFRTPEYTIAHPANTFRIVFFGDAYTAGSNLPPEESYPYQLQKAVTQRCSRFQSEVISLAIGDHRLADNVIKLKAHGESLKPDLLLFQIQVNDVNFYSYFGIYQTLNVSRIHSVYAEKQDQVFQTDSLDWKVFTEGLDVIQDWSKANSVPAVFVVFPPVDSFRSGRNFDLYNPLQMASSQQYQYFKKIVAELERRKLAFVDLEDVFREEAKEQYLGISEKMTGLNSYANRLIAQSVSSFLVNRKLVDCSNTKLKPADRVWAEEDLLRKDVEANWVDFNVSCSKQLDLYERLLELHPKDPWLMSQLADTYYCLEQYQAAFRAYDSLTERSADISEPGYQSAMCSVGAFVARQLLESTVKHIPDHTQAMLSLAKLYGNEKRRPEACALLGRVMEIPAYDQQLKTATELWNRYQCTQIMQ